MSRVSIIHLTKFNVIQAEQINYNPLSAEFFAKIYLLHNELFFVKLRKVCSCKETDLFYKFYDIYLIRDLNNVRFYSFDSLINRNFCYAMGVVLRVLQIAKKFTWALAKVYALFTTKFNDTFYLFTCHNIRSNKTKISIKCL